MTKPQSSQRKAQFPFITISRETGAGGRLLAKTILSEMKKEKNRDLFGGWRLFDGAELFSPLDSPRARAGLSWLESESYRKELEDMFYQVLYDQKPQVDVLGRLFKAILRAAEDGKVIIVGRGAGILCRPLPWGIRVRLVAPLESRVHRMSALSTVSRKTIQREILRRDKDRKWFVRHYFRKNIQDPLLYQATFNTAQMPLKAIARHLIDEVALVHGRQRSALSQAAETAA